MKFSENWLREWTDPPLGVGELAEQLTMAGLEVEGVEPVALSLDHVVAAEILSAVPHPDADRLHVCQVNDGGKQARTVVCGADNATVGFIVPLAQPGARLPNGMAVQVTDLKGVTSEGMLCSAADLGLVDEADQLLRLPDTLKPGTPLAGHLAASDNIIELALTPNRGDCLSIAGVAREVAALNTISLQPVNPEPVPPAGERTRAVQLSAPAACARYAGRVIDAVDVNKTAPLWLLERLHRCGIRSIHPIVDITNYVMLELGQPMHGFDNDRLQGAVQVRFATAGEKLVLLDNQACDLSSDTLVIADEKGPLAMAGVMGGLDSAVTTETRSVFLESAWFEPKTIIGEGRRYGIHTDSAHRFERGVDHTLQVAAIERATRLILDTCGGIPGPVTERVEDKHLPHPQPIQLRADRIERLLGIAMPAEEVTERFRALGCTVAASSGGWAVTPPTYRTDLGIEADLVEELARMRGYNAIPTEMPRSALTFHQVRPNASRQLAELLVHRGYFETITYSFIDRRLQELFTPALESLTLANPIASDLSEMRGSLWPGLVSALQHNLKRQQSRARLFEIGRVFQLHRGSVRQELMIGGLIYGNIYNKQWDNGNIDSNFHHLKGDVEALLRTAGQGNTAFEFTPARHPALHPGQSARIMQGDQELGWMGAMHPALQSELALTGSCFLFELQLDGISQHLTPRYRKLSRFPSIKRDLALLVPEEIALATVTDCIKSAGSELLSNLELFDVYQGEGIDLGKKSLALGLTFQRSSSTLTDEEVEAIVGDVLARLEHECGVTLRE